MVARLPGIERHIVQRLIAAVYWHRLGIQIAAKRDAVSQCMLMLQAGQP